jgi:hypothetical protein
MIRLYPLYRFDPLGIPILNCDPEQQKRTFYFRFAYLLMEIFLKCAVRSVSGNILIPAPLKCSEHHETNLCY